jgi:broad specificity phosphatase PhoE
MPEAHIRDVVRVTQRAKPEPTNGHAVRRVTGSADIPITPEGHEQAEEMSARYSERFDHVFCGPEQRSVDTAEKFGDPIILKGLDAWGRGSYEGYPAKSVAPAMKALILNPSKVPPGKSQISGKPGESFSAFWKPLGHVMREVKRSLKPNERILLVTSGGNLQAIDELAKDGFPAKLDAKNLKAIAESPYWSAVGAMFKLTDDGLKKVTDNKDSAIYAMEHAATNFNPAKTS